MGHTNNASWHVNIGIEYPYIFKMPIYRGASNHYDLEKNNNQLLFNSVLLFPLLNESICGKLPIASFG